MTFEELLSQKKLVAVINATAKSLESSSISYEDCVAEGQLALWSIASSGDSDLSRIDDLGSYLRSAMRNAVSKRVAIDDASGMRYESFDSDTSTRQLTKCDERLLISSGQDSVDRSGMVQTITFSCPTCCLRRLSNQLLLLIRCDVET